MSGVLEFYKLRALQMLEASKDNRSRPFMRLAKQRTKQQADKLYKRGSSAVESAADLVRDTMTDRTVRHG